MWPWERYCVLLSGSKITWQGNTLLAVKFMYLCSTTFLRMSMTKVGEERAGPEDAPRRIELSALHELIGRDSSFRRHMVNGDKEKQKFTPHGLCEPPGCSATFPHAGTLGFLPRGSSWVPPSQGSSSSGSATGNHPGLRVHHKPRATAI